MEAAEEGEEEDRINFTIKTKLRTKDRTVREFKASRGREGLVNALNLHACTGR
jgi:hypothetical protein